MIIFTGNIITYPDNSRVLLEKLFQKNLLYKMNSARKGVGCKTQRENQQHFYVSEKES